jgi:hypothetical protein
MAEKSARRECAIDGSDTATMLESMPIMKAGTETHSSTETPRTPPAGLNELDPVILAFRHVHHRIEDDLIARLDAVVFPGGRSDKADSEFRLLAEIDVRTVGRGLNNLPGCKGTSSTPCRDPG